MQLGIYVRKLLNRIKTTNKIGGLTTRAKILAPSRHQSNVKLDGAYTIINNLYTRAILLHFKSVVNCVSLT